MTIRDHMGREVRIIAAQYKEIVVRKPGKLFPKDEPILHVRLRLKNGDDYESGKFVDCRHLTADGGYKQIEREAKKRLINA